MPRSFLVRNYFRKKYYWLIDDKFDNDAESNDFSEEFCSNWNISDIQVNQDETTNSCEYTYENEKSFWFELNDRKDKVPHHDASLGVFSQDDLLKDIKSKACCKESRNDQESEKEKYFQTSESLESRNIDEKLDHMLQENPEIVKKNIKQFLENNRLSLKEIAEDTGICEDHIKLYMNGTGHFDDDQKGELYRWYLQKILRPPNGQDEKSYTCYKCGKIFAYESYLERHVKYVCPDSTGRTWKCSYCGKAFQYPCYLKRHIRSHTGESPYKCDQCDRAFVRSTDLQRHIRNHTGEKPYKCTECKRAFARSTDLKRHMRTHTGEKPYKCWQCGKTFSQSGSLQTHLHTHNREGSTNRKHAKGSK